MERNIAIILLCLGSTLAAYSQTTQTLLGWIDFDSPPNNLSIPLTQNFNATPNIGSNMWIVNDEYSGQGTYMDTPPQDTTYGGIGEISNPGGKYLHIQNSVSAIINANYDPDVPSERWTLIGSNLCRQGILRFS